MTVFRPQEDKSFHSRSEMFQRIVSCLGGRVAEDLMLSDISTGASGDIQQDFQRGIWFSTDSGRRIWGSADEWN